MRNAQCRGSASYLLGGGETSERSERDTFNKSSLSRKLRYRLHIAPFINEKKLAFKYSSPTSISSNIGADFRFCFDSSPMSEAYLIVPPNIGVPLHPKKNVIKTEIFGDSPYDSGEKDRLQYQGLVRCKAYHVPA